MGERDRKDRSSNNIVVHFGIPWIRPTCYKVVQVLFHTVKGPLMNWPSLGMLELHAFLSDITI